MDHRYVSLQRVGGWILTGVVGFLLFLALAITLGATGAPIRLLIAGPLAWAGIVGFLGASGHTWPSLEYRHLAYRVSDGEIRIRRGVFWRETISIPRNRIQHTDVSQGPLERQFHLATLLVHTAGTEYARVSLPGLEHGRALAIRDHLMGMDEDDAV